MESTRPAKSWKGRGGWVGTWALGFSSIQLGPVFTVMFKILAEAVKEGCGQLLGSPELASSTEPPPCCPCGGKGHCAPRGPWETARPHLVPCAEAGRPPHRGPSSRCQRSQVWGGSPQSNVAHETSHRKGPLVSFKSQHQTCYQQREGLWSIQGDSQHEPNSWVWNVSVLRGPGGPSAFQQRLQRAVTHQAEQTAVPAASSTDSSRTPALQLVILRQCNPGQVPS